MTQPKIDHFEAVRPTSIVQTTIGGVSCYAFSLKAGDVQVWDVGNIGGNGQPNERAEISYAPAYSGDKYKSPYNVTDKTGLQTYDIDYWFKAGWPNHDPAQHQWAVLTQFHPQDINADPFQGFGGITVHNQAMTIGRPDNGQDFATVPIRTETWIKLRMVVNWTSQPNGFAQIVDRATGAVLGRYDGRTIAAGQFKYIKQGYYRAGGLPDGTVYETPIDINAGDLTAAATPTAPTPKKNSAPLDPSKPSVQPNDGARTLMAIRDQLVALKDPRVQPQIDAVNVLLNNGAWTP